jgi:hypothetical protein
MNLVDIFIKRKSIFLDAIIRLVMNEGTNNNKAHSCQQGFVQWKLLIDHMSRAAAFQPIRGDPPESAYLFDGDKTWKKRNVSYI